MNINKIEKLKNNKYKIHLENETIITFDNVIIENNLLYKKNIDDDLYNKLLTDTEYYDIYNKTIKYILKKRRSEKEIKIYLIKNNLSNDKIEKIINKLKDINLINDMEYCKAYINDRVYLSKAGINKIRNELIEQNISLNIINKELNLIDQSLFNDRLEKMIINKINSNKKYSNLYLKNKILNEMIKLGYEKDNILYIIEKNLKDDNLVIKKEFDKMYIKFSKKYNGEELNKKIEQKMMSKGFSKYEVRELLKKTEE